MSEKRRVRILRWISSRLASLVCWCRGHQDFGTAFGQQCLRCGRGVALDLSDLALPRQTQAGDPDRHRMDTGALRASGIVPEVSGDTYARAGKPIELTYHGRQRLESIGWLKPGGTLNVELFNEQEVRRIVKTETERARRLGLLTVQDARDRTRRRRMARNLDIIKPVKGVH